MIWKEWIFLWNCYINSITSNACAVRSRYRDLSSSHRLSQSLRSFPKGSQVLVTRLPSPRTNARNGASRYWLGDNQFKMEFSFQVCLLIPEPTARSGGASVTNSARLFTPGKTRTQRSAKFINDCGRITLAHRWTSLISNIWRTARSGKGKDPKKYMKERLHNTKKSFFNLPLKEW